jgi:hypothetical protein
MYIAVAIGAVVVLIAVWLVVWRRTRKSWCVMFYMVSRLPRTTTPVNWPDPVTGLPQGAPLDAKLRDVLLALDGLPCASLMSVINDMSWDDVHVVYRAVWDDIHVAPVAKVVSWRPGAPVTDYFANENYDPFSIDLTGDLQFFFDWTFENCPADHYAVFFWGHSFGPGGLFEVGEKPVVLPQPAPAPPPGAGAAPPPPPPASPAASPQIAAAPQPQLTFTSLGLGDLGTALLTLVARRELDRPDLVAAGQSLRAEVVFFQDCWMSTLETAYELQDSARYIVGSQSLVPIGYDTYGHLPGAIWPYADLIRALLGQQNYPDSLLQILQTFFDGATLPAGADPEFNRYPNPTMPYSLLDLGPNAGDISTKLTQPLMQLVAALDIASLGRAGRRSLITKPAAGQLFKFSGADLQAGDVALIDVSIFCGYLQNTAAWPSGLAATLSAAERAAIAAAGAALQTALTAAPPLVKNSFESAASPGLLLGFSGISLFYKGGQASPADPYLLQHVSFNYYKSLKFALATTVLLPTSAQSSWAKIAFE